MTFEETQNKFKTVTKEEFYRFIKAYPNKIDVNTVTICEPPLRRFHDFTTGKEIPESVIAQIMMEAHFINGEYDDNSPDYWIYEILEKELGL